jgi:hypothetical protein
VNDQPDVLKLEISKVQVKKGWPSLAGVVKVKTMISQTCLLELELHDKVQVKRGWPSLAKSREG